MRRPVLPAVREQAWPGADLDRFILAEFERRELRPAADAPREALIQRLYQDLIGLPPTFAQVRAFAADTSPGAVEKLVDGLLVSPQFGVRRARHWLDNARYTVIIRSDGEGRIAIPSEPYRDWVVRAFNLDMSYRDFLTYQVAGDLLPDEEVARRYGDPRTGTGVWGLAPYSQNVDPLVAVADHVKDRSKAQAEVAAKQKEAERMNLCGRHLSVFSRRQMLKSAAAGFPLMASARLFAEESANPLTPRPGHHAAKARRAIFLIKPALARYDRIPITLPRITRNARPNCQPSPFRFAPRPHRRARQRAAALYRRHRR